METDVEKLQAEVKRLEAELKELRREYDLTLRAFYIEKQKQFKDEILPTYEEIKRTSTGPIDLSDLDMPR